MLRFYYGGGGDKFWEIHDDNIYSHGPTILSCWLKNRSKINVFHSTGGPEVFVIMITSEKYAVPFNENDTGEDLKHKIEAVSGFPAVKQRLIFKMRQVGKFDKLIECGVSKNSVVFQVINTRG